VFAAERLGLLFEAAAADVLASDDETGVVCGAKRGGVQAHHQLGF
jgi:hypothetical protein